MSSDMKCKVCGGKLHRKNEAVYSCEYCDREYYISKEQIYRKNISFSTGRGILIMAVILGAVICTLLGAYIHRVEKMKNNSQRFSTVFSKFLTDVYDENIANVDDKDLNKIKYLKIDKDKEGYVFEYSFTDRYCVDEKVFEKSLKRVVVSGEGYACSDIQYFGGLTQLKLYVGAWENYILPEKNVIRSIHCVDGYSKYGKPEFFEAVNHKTLEEVVIYKADGLTDYSFVKDISKIKRFVIEDAVIKDYQPFIDFENLKELSLINPEIKEAKAYEVIEGLVSIPTLKHFEIQGPGGYCLSDGQWDELKERYGSKVQMERE